MICLRDLLYDFPHLGRNCFYCGLRATEVDHSRPRRQLGTHHGNNLKPACHRCNMRKRDKTRAEFRAFLVKIDRAMLGRPSEAIQFYGEGARGQALRRLRRLLTLRLRDGRAVKIDPPSEATQAKRQERKLERTQIRWRGRFTFTGGRALRALAAATGCTFPVIERFVLGVRILPKSQTQLTTACKELKLSVKVLRDLKPPR